MSSTCGVAKAAGRSQIFCSSSCTKNLVVEYRMTKFCGDASFGGKQPGTRMVMVGINGPSFAVWQVALIMAMTMLMERHNFNLGRDFAFLFFFSSSLSSPLRYFWISSFFGGFCCAAPRGSNAAWKKKESLWPNRSFFARSSQWWRTKSNSFEGLMDG
ncbi:hypothetical protein F5Y04DRAFT_248568 [Hypomontagnella monticulosa]|nr:hypothetical protein F5Y04DRAFT_248568 [Hypomontagnella monticulosa]